MKKLLLLFAVLLTALRASAYDFEVDGIYYDATSLSDLTCKVTSGNTKYSGNVSIPSTVSYSGITFSVTTIGNSAFSRCSSLTSVVIGNSVTTIGEEAFYNCFSLNSVVIGNSVTTIGEKAFYNCSGLTSVKIPNSVTTIGEYAFSRCSSLTSVVIPNSVTYIGGVFYGCSGLTSVVIPNSVTSIGQNTFYGCTGLTSVVIPNSVTSIGQYAFYGCSGLKSVKIPNSVTTISYNAFSGCTGLNEITCLAVTPPRIEESTFKNVSMTTTILKVPTESVQAYKEANYWNLFWNLFGLNGEGGGEEPVVKQCEEPEISIVDGKLLVKTATIGAKCYTSIKTSDYKAYDGTDPIELTGIYSISSYAHAEGMQSSETVTATLVWVNPSIESTRMMSMEAKKAVLIRAKGGNIFVSGTEAGEHILLYSVDGKLLTSVNATADETVIPHRATNGEIVIVKYGEKSVKIKM